MKDLWNSKMFNLTPLHCAAGRSYLEIAEILVSQKGIDICIKDI